MIQLGIRDLNDILTSNRFPIQREIIAIYRYSSRLPVLLIHIRPEIVLSLRRRFR